MVEELPFFDTSNSNKPKDGALPSIESVMKTDAIGAKPRKVMSLVVDDLMCITNSLLLQDYIFSCACANCQHQWSTYPEDVKLGKENTLFLFCEECSPKDYEYRFLPTLREVASRVVM